MRKITSKILSVILTISMLLSTASMLAFAEGEVNPIIANFTFEDVADDFVFSYKSAYYDDTKTYYMSSSANGKVVLDSDPEHGKIVKYSAGYFGIAEQFVKEHAAYKDKATADYPKKIKLELEIKKGYDAAITLNLNANADAKIMNWASGGAISFVDGAFGKNSTGATGTYTSSGVTLTKDDGWVKFTFYFDMVTKKYHAFINNVYKGEFSLPSTVANITSVFFTNSSKKDMYVDDMIMSTYETLDLTGSTPADKATGVNPLLDAVSVEFGEELNTVTDAMVTIETVDGDVTADYEGSYSLSQDGKILTISFEEALELGTTYKVSLASSIQGTSGLSLGLPGVPVGKSITFTVANDAKLYVSDPVFADGNVTAKVANYSGEDETAVLVIVETQNDDSVALIEESVDLADGDSANLTKAFTLTGQGAVAFITDGGKTKLLTDAFVENDNATANSDSTAMATASITTVADGQDVTVSGQLSVSGKRNVVLKVIKDGDVQSLVPFQTDEDGSFTKELQIDEDGNYSVSLIGYNMTKADSTIKRLTPAKKAEIEEAIIVETSSPAEMSEALKLYKDDMSIDDKWSKSYIYTTVFEQKEAGEVSEYAEILAMITTAETLFASVNSTDAEGYTELLTENKDIILYDGVSDVAWTKYQNYTPTQKAEFNALILAEKGAGFADFGAVRAAFNKATTKYVPSIAETKEIEKFKIVDFDFENVPDDEIKGAPYYATPSALEIVEDSQKEEGDNQVVKLINGDTFGVLESHLKQYSKFDPSTATYPDKIKISFEMKRMASIPVYLYGSAPTTNEFMLWSGSTSTPNIQLEKEGTNRNWKGTDKYNNNTWIKVEIYIDFKNDVYHFYSGPLNNVKYQTTQVLRSAYDLSASNQGFKDIVVNFYAKDKTGEAFIDNFKIYEYESFVLDNVTPANDAENVNVTEDVKFTFTSNLALVDAEKITVKKDGNVVPSTDYNILPAGNSFVINFKNALEAGKTYEVTVKADAIKDEYGQVLDGVIKDGDVVKYDGVPKAAAQDMIVTFTTASVGTGLLIGEPVFTDTEVSAKVANYTGADKSLALVVVERKADGSVELIEGVNSVKANLADGQSEVLKTSFSRLEKDAVAFVTDLSKAELLIDTMVNEDNTVVKSNSPETQVSAVLEDAKLLGETLTVSGKVTPVGKRNIAIKLTKVVGGDVLIVPLQTGADGKFSQGIKLSESGEYDIKFVGYNMTSNVDKKIFYLDAEQKQMIVDYINRDSTNTAAKIGAFLKNDKYLDVHNIEDMMRLGEKYLKTYIYQTILEQKPYDGYDALIEQIYEAEDLLTKVNNTSWVYYTDLLKDNKDVLLFGVDEEMIEDYEGYSKEKQGKINQKIVDKKGKGFVDFVTLREAFTKALTPAAQPEGSTPQGGAVISGTPSTPTIVAPGGNPVVAPSQGTVKLFKDLDKASWATKSVERLHSMGIISAAEEFRPLDSVTREEFVKMLVQLAGIKVDGKTSTFTDAKAGEWYVPYLAAAQEAGIVKGNDDGTFGVGKKISRQDMVVMAQRAIAVMKKTVKAVKEAQNFADSSNISDYAQSAVEEMQRAGVISGMGDGSFAPTETANRAQAAVVVSNLIDAIE